MPGTVSTTLFLATLAVLTFAIVCAGLVGGAWGMYRLFLWMRSDFTDDLARARSDCEREIQDLRAASRSEMDELNGRIQSLETTLEKAILALGGGMNMQAGQITIGRDAIGRDRNEQNLTNLK